VVIAAPPVVGNVSVIRSQGGGLLGPPGTPGSLFGNPYVWDAQTALRIPAVQRAVALYAGMTKQMPLDAYRGTMPLPRPSLLARPDPNRARSFFVQCSVEDYLLNGNAISLVTSRGADGWPLSVSWLPAAWVYIAWQPYDESSIDYYLLGSKLPFADVIHVRNGADRYYPVRGVGVIERQLDTLDRIAMEEQYERSALAAGAVPSVAIITPQPTLTQDIADAAKESWLGKFGGPTREPAILPNGTQVIPLAWSPSDAQLTEARRMSLVDVANMFNLDGYWLGSPTAGMTYKTAAPQYQQILRTSIEPVIADFEDVWSYAWLPRGQQIRFDRNQLLRDDLTTTAAALVALVGAGILTPADARIYLALPAVSGGGIGGPMLSQTGSPDLEPGESPAGETGGPDQ
jgi:HK97 family phage portal protein